ncbi:MAG: restriction endonuclease subunit S [Bacteroidia bacterium]
MKQGWEMKRLDQVCTFINGKAYNKNELLERGKYPVLRVGNFFTNNHWYYSDLELPEDKYCDNGDLLYAWSASFGPRIWTGEKVIYHYHIWKILPDSKLITKEFLFLLLDWDTEKIKKDQGTGTTMMHVGKGSMDARIVPIPPLLEQQRIVAIVEEAFVAIAKAKANAEQNLKNAKELFACYVQTVFENKGKDWEEKTLSEIADVEYGYTDKSTEEGNYRYVRITDIDKNGELILKDKKYIKHSKEAEGFLIQNNDLLMARTGATFAKVLLFKGDEPSVFASYLIRIKFKEKIENALYWHFTKTNNYWEQANSLQSGAAQPHFNGAAVKQVVFAYPKSVKEQKVLIEKFDTLSIETKKLENIYLKKLEDLEEFKKSVLQKAFCGELITSTVLV